MAEPALILAGAAAKVDAGISKLAKTGGQTFTIEFRRRIEQRQQARHFNGTHTTMAELPAEKIHTLREAIARLRCAAHELDVLLAEVEPTSTTTAMINPELTDFMEKVLPADERQRLTEILPQLADGSDSGGAARAHKPRQRSTRRPKVRQS